jgi:SAM-dependent methyltransferase
VTATEEQWRAQANSFGAAAAAYDRGRPSYPRAAIDWLLDGSGRRVLDLGAGTGKLTRQFHLSPTLHEHINPYGKYRFDVDGGLRRSGLRPLRQPDEWSMP